MARAARAQAPRGQAVRADGAPTSHAARALVELGRGGGGAADGPRAADRARAAARRRARVAPAVAPGCARPRRDAAVLAAAPPAARRRRRPARDDERQRLRRADRLPRRGRARAPGARSPTSSSSTTARSTTRTDDSVVRAVAGRPPVRCAARAGTCRRALALPRRRRRDVLACGAELKSTFCVAKGARAWVGHHIGDLANSRRCASFREGIAHFERLFAVAPEVVAHDLHPDYLSTALRARARGRRARRRPAPPRAPRGLPGRARRDAARRSARSSTARATGRTARCGAASCSSATSTASSAPGTCGRCACRAATRPCASRGGWRARGWSRRRGDGRAAADPGGARRRRRRRALARGRALARSGVAAPVTTSAGRLFDAVAALCGLRATRHLRGPGGGRARGGLRPARARRATRCPVARRRGARRARDDPARSPRDVAARRPAPASWPRASTARWRDATARACARSRPRRGTDCVVLSGGVFQNCCCSSGRRARLDAAGLRVLVPERLPPNDGGIAYGQAAVAAARRGAAAIDMAHGELERGRGAGAGAGRAGARRCSTPSRTRRWRRCGATARRGSAAPRSSSGRRAVHRVDVAARSRRSTCSATRASPSTAARPTRRSGAATRRSPGREDTEDGHRGTGRGRRTCFRLDITELVVVRLGDPADHLVIESWHEGRGVSSIRR